MSLLDDQSILAMQAARMSLASIAATMGWGVERTAKRLQLLNGDASAVVVPFAGDLDPEPVPVVAPIATIDEKPVAPGEGLILRSFALTAGGFGAVCLLADGGHAFTVTGRDRQEPGKRIRVEQVREADVLPPQVADGAEPPPAPTGFVWRMIKAKADA